MRAEQSATSAAFWFWPAIFATAAYALLLCMVPVIKARVDMAITLSELGGSVIRHRPSVLMAPLLALALAVVGAAPLAYAAVAAAAVPEAGEVQKGLATLSSDLGLHLELADARAVLPIWFALSAMVWLQFAAALLQAGVASKAKHWSRRAAG